MPVFRKDLAEVVKAKLEADTQPQLFHSVIARPANPDSKRASVHVLESDFGVQVSLPQVCRTVDLLAEDCIERLNALAGQSHKIRMNYGFQFHSLTRNQALPMNRRPAAGGAVTTECERCGPVRPPSENGTVGNGRDLALRIPHGTHCLLKLAAGPVQLIGFIDPRSLHAITPLVLTGFRFFSKYRSKLTIISSGQIRIATAAMLAELIRWGAAPAIDIAVMLGLLYFIVLLPD